MRTGTYTVTFTTAPWFQAQFQTLLFSIYCNKIETMGYDINHCDWTKVHVHMYLEQLPEEPNDSGVTGFDVCLEVVAIFEDTGTKARCCESGLREKREEGQK